MDVASLDASLGALRDGYLTLCRLTTSIGTTWGTDPDLAWGITPLAIGDFNRVTGIRMEPDRTEARVQEVMRRYADAGLPATWWLDPHSTPHDLGTRLLGLGMTTEAVPAMRIELEDLPATDLPAGVTLSWARDEDEVMAAMLLVAVGFGLPTELAEEVAQFLAATGRPETPALTVVASLDGRPVAAAQGIHLGQSVVIYNVATLQEARGRGIGAAVTTAVLRDAASTGARFGVLESSELGHAVYQRVGFRDVATFEVFRLPG